MFFIKKSVQSIILVSVFILPFHYCVLAQATEEEFATIELITEPKNAQVFINQISRGSTPIKIDSLVTGTYEIRLVLKGYNSFNEKINLMKWDKKKLIIQLQKSTGYLYVISWPEDAFIILDNDTIAKTPFYNEVKTGSYEITLTKPKYFSFKDIINIIPNDTTQISKKLFPEKMPQNIRRVVFGSFALGFASLGAYINYNKLEKAQSAEEKAWDNYMQLNLTPSEYDKLYKIYKEKVNETNNTIVRRNAYFTIAGLAGIGLVISIPF